MWSLMRNHVFLMGSTSFGQTPIVWWSLKAALLLAVSGFVHVLRRPHPLFLLEGTEQMKGSQREGERGKRNSCNKVNANLWDPLSLSICWLRELVILWPREHFDWIPELRHSISIIFKNGGNPPCNATKMCFSIPLGDVALAKGLVSNIWLSVSQFPGFWKVAPHRILSQ